MIGRHCRSTVGLFAGAALFFTPAAGAQSAGDPAAGERLASSLCAGCHAVAATGESPLVEAPPFRDLASKWPAEHLAEALAEGIVAGGGAFHMPEFALAPEEIDDLLAYLGSLR